MSQATFATIPDVIEAARAALAPELWDHLVGGAGTEWTVRRNRAALEEFVFRPHLLVDVRDRQTAASLLGRELRIPIFLAPIGSVGFFHPDGALAVARVAERAGTMCFVNANAVADPADITSRCDAPLVLQIYGYDDADRTRRQLRRAEESGCLAVCITVSSPVSPWRDRQLRQGFRSPAARFDEGHGHAGFTWDALEQVRGWTDLPLVLKGILGVDDALRAVDRGVEVIYVSNLGGRALDFAPATIDVLPEIVAAVDGQVTVIVDGGFQRGTDVLKGLALGATAVGIGKLQGWALAAGGEAGLEGALALLERELLATMAMVGVTDVRAASRADLRPHINI